MEKKSVPKEASRSRVWHSGKGRSILRKWNCFLLIEKFYNQVCTGFSPLELLFGHVRSLLYVMKDTWLHGKDLEIPITE